MIHVNAGLSLPDYSDKGDVVFIGGRLLVLGGTVSRPEIRMHQRLFFSGEEDYSRFHFVDFSHFVKSSQQIARIDFVSCC